MPQNSKFWGRNRIFSAKSVCFGKVTTSQSTEEEYFLRTKVIVSNVSRCWIAWLVVHMYMHSGWLDVRCRRKAGRILGNLSFSFLFHLNYLERLDPQPS